MSSVSQYRLREEIRAVSADGLSDTIPSGAIVEYTPSVLTWEREKLIEVRWGDKCYRVSVADMFQRAEFIGTREQE